MKNKKVILFPVNKPRKVAFKSQEQITNENRLRREAILKSFTKNNPPRQF
ncbi:hypothetical protein J2TS6_44630 [Paenibacillus albilobatus]|uniref:Uncharacterized protein n=1 Tax=Paenibacillus albilobatus TaxID=2716884 RepID=A0A919XMC8_9BACL|nr:hypothetical protein J2TS6_44630 [Paenibacillus albilobatus]